MYMFSPARRSIKFLVCKCGFLPWSTRLRVDRLSSVGCSQKSHEGDRDALDDFDGYVDIVYEIFLAVEARELLDRLLAVVRSAVSVHVGVRRPH